jgi:hypothetical protein
LKASLESVARLLKSCISSSITGADDLRADLPRVKK